MLRKLGYLIAPLTVASFTGSACAMNPPSHQQIDCRVIGGEKLLTEIGGPDALCAAIARAAVSADPSRRFSVEVRVLSSSSLAATLTTADGTTLPEQRFAISDRNLSKGSLDRFAQSLVDEVSRAASR